MFATASLALFFLAAGAPTPLLPIYEAEWHFALSMLTLAFGVYALGLLVALLIFGSLSDHIGRRPLLISAFVLELVSMLVFLASSSIGWIITARALQGIATGAATSAVSAAVIELAPDHRKGIAATMTSTAPAAGLGIGAVFAGAVAQFSDAATATVWTVLVVLTAIGTLLAMFVPETTQGRPGALASLVPRATVPAQVRRGFAVAVPTQVAAWMMAALFFGLVPTILGAVFDRHSPLESGLTAFIVPAMSTITAITLANVAPHRLMLLGVSSVVVAALLVTTSVVATAQSLLWLGGIVAGVAFGSTLTGTFRSLIPQVPAHESAGLFAAIYTVAYLAFGVPAIIAGMFVSSEGVTDVAVTFGIVTAFVGALGLVGRMLLRSELTVVAADPSADRDAEIVEELNDSGDKD